MISNLCNNMSVLGMTSLPTCLKIMMSTERGNLIQHLKSLYQNFHVVDGVMHEEGETHTIGVAICWAATEVEAAGWNQVLAAWVDHTQ